MDKKALIERLSNMCDRSEKATYGLGDWWEAVDEAYDALVEYASENAALKAEVKALRKLLYEVAQEAHTMGRIYEKVLSPVNPAIEYNRVDEMVDRLTRAAKGE